MRKRLRQWIAALTQRWHLHACGCGEVYLCTRPLGCEPYTCIDCEILKMEAWRKDYEARLWRRNGAA